MRLLFEQMTGFFGPKSVIRGASLKHLFLVIIRETKDLVNDTFSSLLRQLTAKE